MAYEVTKRINGHDYRYRVEGYRDPKSGRTRTRWQYLGRVLNGGVIAASSRRSDRISREKIVLATAELLESRDGSRVTVSVIARHAGISPATFYRYFPDRKSAFTAALTHLADQTLGEITLDGPLVGTREEEPRRVSEWLDGLHRRLLRQRAFRWSFAAIDRSKAKGRIERSLLKHDATAMLTRYLQRLREAGIATINDPAGLAVSIMHISVAFIHFTANDELNPERRGLRVTDAFPVIERAIFGQ